MDPAPKDDWITALTRPLKGNPELHLGARHELSDYAAQADTGQLEKIRKRCEEVDCVTPEKRKFLFWSGMIAVLLVVIGAGFHAFRFQSETRELLQVIAGSHNEPAEYFRPALSAEEHFFVFGDTSQPDPELAARALWQSAPDNPVLFADYISHCSSLPPDMIETAERIEPDNGWFLLLAAGEISKSCVDRHYPSPTKSNPHPEPEIRIIDQLEYERALELLRQAAAKPYIRSHEIDLRKQRLNILPPEHDFSSRLQRILFAVSGTGGNIGRTMKLSLLSEARAQTIGQSGTTVDLRAWQETLKTLLIKLTESETPLLDQIINNGLAIQSYSALHEAQKALGMSVAAEDTRLFNERLELIVPGSSAISSHDSEVIEKQSGYLAIVTLPSASSMGGPTITPEDLLPERRANYALLDRAALLAGSLLLALLILAPFILRYIRGPYALLLGKRIACLLTWRDHLWIFGLGIILPLASLLGITRFTPLGCRDWGLSYADFQPVLTQYLCGLLLMICGIIATARCRLRRRVGRAGLVPPSRFRDYLPLIALALAIPVAGLVRTDWEESALHGAWTLGGLALIWLLVRVAVMVCGQRRFSPYRASLSSAVIPAMLLGSMLLFALIPLTHQAERYWFARDELMRTSAENHGFNRVEALTSEALRRRLRETLNAAP